MANYQSIIRLWPEVREFIRNRRWVHCGEALAYGPNISAQAFSTDALGYRHSVFEKRGVPIAGPGHVNNLGFVDEFHYDNDGTASLCDDFAKVIAPLL